MKCIRVYFWLWAEYPADEIRCQVQVIILQHHQGWLRFRQDLFGHRFGKQPVDHHVTILPVLPGGAVNGRRAENIPHGMLQEP